MYAKKSQYLSLSKFFFIFSIVLVSFLFAGASANAATYYVRADGTVLAVNKANATSCSSADTSLNAAQHNTATFSAGDTIYLCGNGGDFTSAIIPPSSGSAGSPVIYQGSGSPKINGTGTGIEYLFDVNSDLSKLGYLK